MSRSLRLLSSALLLALAACTQAPSKPAAPVVTAAAKPAAQTEPGAMQPDRAIFDNLSKSPQHETFEAAIRAGGMVNRLRKDGPFTVFAPDEAAFAALPDGMLATLLEPASKVELVTLLNLHIVPGALDNAALSDLIAAGGGRARVTTLKGGELTLLPAGGGDLLLIDAAGHQARIVSGAMAQANGVVYVVDQVLLP